MGVQIGAVLGALLEQDTVLPQGRGGPQSHFLAIPLFLRSQIFVNLFLALVYFTNPKHSVKR